MKTSIFPKESSRIFRDTEFNTLREAARTWKTRRKTVTDLTFSRFAREDAEELSTDVITAFAKTLGLTSETPYQAIETAILSHASMLTAKEKANLVAMLLAVPPKQ